MPNQPQVVLPGARLIDGSNFNDLVNQFNSLAPTAVTALAGGGRTGAPILQYANNIVSTVATAADSVQLPIGYPGAICVVRNTGANAMQVFAQGSDTINATAGSTGVSQAVGGALYWCLNGVNWLRFVAA